MSFIANAQVFGINGHQFDFASNIPVPPTPPAVGAVINGYSVITPPTYTASGPLVYYQGTTDLIIENKSFTGLSSGIQLWECANIIIRNCKFKNISGTAIHYENCANITVENCVFDSIGDGVIATSNASNPYNGGTNSSLVVQHCYFKNTTGGWPGHHSVQMAGTSGGGTKINYNTFENIHLQSHVDDIISMFDTFGSMNDSVQIIGNWFRGGDHNLENHTGGAITVGDNGSSYIHVKNNILVNVVGGGIGLAGGHDITVENNTLYQSQALANPANQTAGLIMFNFDANPSISTCYNNTIQKNRVYYQTSAGNTINWEYSATNKNCTDAQGTATNVADPTLNASILPEVISNLYHY